MTTPATGSTITTTVAIIGAGFSGLSTAIRLRRAKIEDFVILERGAEIGGTWRDSTFPGAACDVSSLLYSLSTDPYPEWRRTFAEQEQILEYTRRCFDRHDLHPRVLLNANATSATFEEAEGRWRITTEDGREVCARALVLACGPLSTPAWPDLPDRERFRGALFHAARWRHDCALEGKRVGVIGTGATAVQFVPEIVDKVGALTVFQRTPPWIVPRPDRPVSAFARSIYRRWPLVQRFMRLLVYLSAELKGLPFTSAPRLAHLGEKITRRHMEQAIADPELRAKLTPSYTFGCKRVLLSNDYYPALTHERATLETASIERFTEDGVLTRDGRRHAFDVLVCATGYDLHTQPAPFSIFGRGGEPLAERWGAFPQAYKGTTISGFPNLFFLAGPNTRIGHTSQLFMIESQVRYAVSAVATLVKRGVRAYDVRREVQDAYNAKLQARLRGSVWESGCQSFYRTPEGKNTTIWPGFTFVFRARTGRFDVKAYEALA
ncbi:MAG: NAD(P)/FAD-dependent oxidoreductase [Kofleriaceae bacterium]